MEILLIVFLCCIPVMLFVYACLIISDNNKNKDGYNIYNSTLGVQCNAKEKCDDRFTSTCNLCKHNCGMKERRSSYKPR